MQVVFANIQFVYKQHRTLTGDSYIRMLKSEMNILREEVL